MGGVCELSGLWVVYVNLGGLWVVYVNSVVSGWFMGGLWVVYVNLLVHAQ